MAIIDLTHPMKPDMPTYPGDQQPVFAPVASLNSHGYVASLISFTTHTGTHIDSPAHCLNKGKTLDQFPASHFIGQALVIDCRQVRGDITLSHLAPLGSSLNTDFLLILTGWDRYWKDKRYFIDFPVLSAQAVTWLATQSIKGIGLDTPSIDGPDATNLPNHRQLLNKDILIIENLTRLDLIPGGHSQLLCLPLLITGTDAAPARVIACC